MGNLELPTIHFLFQKCFSDHKIYKLTIKVCSGGLIKLDAFSTEQVSRGLLTEDEMAELHPDEPKEDLLPPKDNIFHQDIHGLPALVPTLRLNMAE